MDLAIKIIMLVIFFGSMIGIGIYCRKNSTDVNGFVLGGRSVGPWLTAFAYGTSYWLEIRNFLCMGRCGQCRHRFSAGMGNSRPAHPYHDPASGKRNHAPVLRIPF